MVQRRISRRFVWIPPNQASGNRLLFSREDWRGISESSTCVARHNMRYQMKVHQRTTLELNNRLTQGTLAFRRVRVRKLTKAGIEFFVREERKKKKLSSESATKTRLGRSRYPINFVPVLLPNLHRAPDGSHVLPPSPSLNTSPRTPSPHVRSDSQLTNHITSNRNQMGLGLDEY